MAQIDYQAHNFTCYTVPECSSNDELEYHADTAVAKYGSQYSLQSTESTTSSIDNNILHNQNNHNHIKYYSKLFNPYWMTTTTQQQQQQRLSVPLIMSSVTANSPQCDRTYQQYANTTLYQQMMPPFQNTYHQLQAQQKNVNETSAQLGYFVPFAPNCYFSPPIQRKKLRYCLII